MRARIDIVRTRYPHWGAHSGVWQFLKHLSSDRFAIEQCVASDGDEDFQLGNSLIRGWLRRAVQRKGMAWYKLSDVRAEARALRRGLSGQVDIVHYLDGEHSAQYLPLVRGMARASRPRLIATFHQPPSVLPGLVRADVVRRLDQVTVVAPAQAEFFEQFLPRERIHSILHGIDTVFFQPSPHRPRRAEFACLTVGHYLRDFVAVRRVAERLVGEPDIRFHVVTGRETGLEGLANVTQHRGLSDEALLSRYQQSDVLFLPLLDCTANNALLEGLACGLPVITTDLPAVHTYAPGEEAVRVRGNEADNLAAAITMLQTSPARRELMGRAARRRAEQLSWPEVALAYAGLYDQALTAPASGGRRR
jgi:glycosyltransferase involved in cell wall biosynthesis